MPNPKLVLVVEDNTGISDAMKGFIEDAITGVSVKICPTLNEAKEFLATNVPDLISTDLRYQHEPGGVFDDLAGEKLLAQVLGDERFNKVPLMLVSSMDLKYLVTLVPSRVAVRERNHLYGSKQCAEEIARILS